MVFLDPVPEHGELLLVSLFNSREEEAGLKNVEKSGKRKDGESSEEHNGYKQAYGDFETLPH